MTIIILENPEPQIRGECSKYLLEVKANVFIGTISKIVQDLLWERIKRKDLKGSILIRSDDSEPGFSIKIYGDLYRSIEDFDGLYLIKRKYLSVTK